MDLWGAEAVLRMKEIGYRDVRLLCAIPFKEYDAKWPSEQKARLNNILNNAEESIIVNEHDTKDAYKRRNYYMVEHSQYLVAVFNHLRKMRSGTQQTVNHAIKRNLNIIYIHPEDVSVMTTF